MGADKQPAADPFGDQLKQVNLSNQRAGMARMVLYLSFLRMGQTPEEAMGMLRDLPADELEALRNEIANQKTLIKAILGLEDVVPPR